MANTVLYAGAATQRAAWASALDRAARAQGYAGRFVMDPDAVSPEEVDVLLFAPDGAVADMRAYPRLQAILSLWAGVETIVQRADLPEGVPIARMVEPGLTEGMVEYVVGHALRAHLGMDRQFALRAARRWEETPAPLARHRRIGVMGLGALGRRCAEALRDLGFDVAGWSRTPKAIEGVTTMAGPEDWRAFLARSEILIVLMPLTEETRGMLGSEALALLPRDAHLINVARGPIVVESALLEALRAEGGLAGATLDVFDVEPLPEDHPYWSEPAIMITPHIASVTRPETAAEAVVEQLVRLERGAPLAHLVDRARGY